MYNKYKVQLLGKVTEYWKALTGYRWLLILLVVCIGINVVQFASIDANSSNNWKAVHKLKKKKTPFTVTKSVNERYSYLLAIYNYAPHTVLISPKDESALTFHNRFTHRIYGIARIASIQTYDYNAEVILKDFIPKKNNIVAAGEYTDLEKGMWDRQNYIVALDKKSPAREIVYATQGDTDLFIDVSLLSPEQKMELKK